MAAKGEASAGTWAEVCKKVSYGDGLYMECREKITGFDGFQNGAFDQRRGPDQGRIDKTSVDIPTAPQRPSSDEVDLGDMEEVGGFWDDLMSNPLLLYGGVAVVAYWLFFRKKQPIAVTETPEVKTPVTTPKAA